MRDSAALFIIGVIYLAILYRLVRPASQGPKIIDTVLGTFADLVRGVTGETFDTNTSTWSTGG